MTRGVLTVLAALGFAACPPNSLNHPCSLRYADGGYIPESKARELTLNNKDFVYLGSVECDSLICVRDSTFRAATGVGDSDPAGGYCSLACDTEGKTCETDTPADDQPGSVKRVSCRKLLLSPQVLADPDIRAALGNIAGSLFCARSQRDAGI